MAGNFDKLKSVEIEKAVIAGCLKFPTLFYEVEPFVTQNDFTLDIHSTVFSIVKSQTDKGESIDAFLIAERIKNSGISFRDGGANVFEYLNSLQTLFKVTEKGFVTSAKELKKLSICRDFYKSSLKLQEYLTQNSHKDYPEIISSCDKIYNDQITAFDVSDLPENIFEDIQEFIEMIGETPQDEAGFLTPHVDLNNFHGGLRPKNLYAYTARAGQGKTTFLADMCYKTCNVVPSNIGKNIQCLYLDTEMEKEDMQKRMVASISGVPFWYIDTGNWRKDPEMVRKVRAAWPLIQNYKFHHFSARNKSIEELIAIARRWYYSQVGRGNPAIVCYDYLKITGETVSDSWKEYQVIGQKTDKLKKLSEELTVPLLTSTQLNRSGENQNKKAGNFSDDSSAIAMSDRLQWFASYVGIFRKKTIDEIELDGEHNGTHKLITTKGRFQGKFAAGHSDFVQREIDGEKKLVANYISFNVDNFHVSEVGALSSMMKRGTLKLHIFDGDGNVVKTTDESGKDKKGREFKKTKSTEGSELL